LKNAETTTNSYKQVEQVTVDSAQPGDLYFLSRQAIEERVSNRQSRIGFVGLGRVGLPLAATLAGKGFAVTGIDIKEDIVNAVNAGRSPYLDEAGLPELIRETTASGALSATTQIAAIEKCDMVIIAVPTLIKDEEPDIEAVKRASSEIAQHFSPGKVLVLQSTVPPHTTRNVLARAIEEKTGLRAGEDFGLAYSPERTQSPQVLRDLGAYPRIVGGVDEQSAFITSSVYSTFAPGIIDMGSLVAAEIEKVIENAYRDVNIAFANELARTCEIYGVDVHRIIEAANSQPFSHILEPGLVGGHCIPMDPYYIISDASRRGFTPPLMQAARDINESIFQHVVDMVDAGLGNSGSPTTKTPPPFAHGNRAGPELQARRQVFRYIPYSEAGKTAAEKRILGHHTRSLSEWLGAASRAGQVIFEPLSIHGGFRLPDTIHRPPAIQANRFCSREGAHARRPGYRYQGRVCPRESGAERVEVQRAGEKPGG